MLPALHTWKTSHRCLRVVKNDSDVCTEFAEYWSNNTFRLFQHRDEQMLRLNLLVLILKVGLGRGQPGLADPSFFVGGMAYPSGHTANIVLVYGLAVYLLGRYLRVSRRTYAVGWVLVQVPDFKTFDPIQAGLVPVGTRPESPESLVVITSPPTTAQAGCRAPPPARSSSQSRTTSSGRRPSRAATAATEVDGAGS